MSDHQSNTDCAEEVEIECDIKFLPVFLQDEVCDEDFSSSDIGQEEVPMYRKRKAYDTGSSSSEVGREEIPMYSKRKAYDDDASSSQLKRGRLLSTIVEDPDLFSLEGEPVFEEVAEYDEKSKMFIQEGRRMDLISLIRKLSEQMEENPPEQQQEESGLNVDANDNILDLLHSSQFFQQRKQMFRPCPSSKVEKEFDQTDPSLPEGIRVREKLRGNGVRKDREFLNSEGTLIFRSKAAVLEYLKIMEGDNVKEEDDEHDHVMAETSEANNVL